MCCVVHAAVVTDAWVRTKVGSFVVSSAATLFVTKKLPPPGALHQFVEQLSPPDRAHFESLSKHESARKMKFTKAMIWVLQKLDGELSLNLTFQNRGARMAKGQIAAVRDKGRW